ncbi:MAG TPA: hypothetical protein VFH66_11390 [Mycobacteriales bacterium]|nr:hypothetical protein [Mycobacteriales bacterium]
MRAGRRWWLTGGIAAVTALAVATPGGSAVRSSSAVSGLDAYGVPHVYPAGTNPEGVEHERLATAPESVDNVDAVGAALAQDRQARQLPTVDGTRRWVSRGPYGVDMPPGYSQSGEQFERVAGMGAAVASPAGHPDTVYIGNMGGLWRSTDAGAHWTNLSNGKLPRAAVGAIAIDPTDPKILYVGTGITFNSLSGDAVGTGIYVSRDGGRTFTRPAQTTTGYAVTQISVSSAAVLAATNNGLFRSTDKGRHFTRVALPTGAGGKPATGPFANWVSSVVAKPGAPKEFTAAVGFFYGKTKLPDGKVASPGNGLYRSTDAGSTWQRLAGTDTLHHPASSSDPVGRVVLAYGQAPGQSDVLWAAVSDAGLAAGAAPGGLDVLQDASGQNLNATNTVFNGLYRSDDDGTSFNVKATPQTLETSPNSLLALYGGLGYGIGVQGDYNLWVQTDPKVPDQVYLGLEEVFQGTPAVPGAGSGPAPYTFSTIQRYADLCGFLTYTQNVTNGASCPDQTPIVGGKSTHPDQHAAIVVPTATGSRIYTGNDGGFFRQDSHQVTPADTGNQTTTGFDNQHWSSMNTLATLQPWNVALLPDNEVIVGLQDNGAALVPKGSNHGIEICGGDGVNVLPTPNPDVFYCSYTGASMYVTTDHGKNIRGIPPDLTAAQFLSPAEIDPTDPNHLVAAANDIKETTKGANTQVLYDSAATGTVVQSDWTESFSLGNSPVKNPATGKPYLWQTTALGIRGANVYAAICGPCRGAFTDANLLKAAIATNVKPGCTPAKGASKCWHIAAGRGLPKGYPTGITIDPTDKRTIYVTFGELNPYGYPLSKTGTARVLMSHDGGASFTDITGNLPKGSVYGVVYRAGHLIVATETGVYQDAIGDGKWAHLGGGLPRGIPVRDIFLDSTGRRLLVGLYGQAAWELDLGHSAVSSSGPGAGGAPTAGGGGAGGTLSNTGSSPAVPIAALVLMVAAGVMHRRRRVSPRSSRTSRTLP